MKPKTVVTLVLLGFVCVSIAYLVVSETRTERKAPQPVASVGREPSMTAPAHKVVAYYFHNTQRCQTCLKIERLAEETLRNEFAGALAQGELEWRVLNMEEPPNEHFATDYELVTSSLVIVDLHNGEQHAWTNMERVWELVHDEEAAFREYVANQVRTYMES